MDNTQTVTIARIAVLMTCHNRRDTTLRCLRALYSQRLPEAVEYVVYLVDDGSSDGTGEAIRQNYPNVNVLRGDGNLYWCGGMRLAWKAAVASARFDHYLWLNDDTVLGDDAIGELLRTATESPGVVVGSCRDPQTGAWTYGGRATPGGGKSLVATAVLPSGRAQPCQIINGNVVLVPAAVYEHIGGLDTRYTHAIGDVDYGFRALDAGISVVVAPHYQGICTTNKLPAWCNPRSRLWDRLTALNDPKGIHFSEFMAFCRRHFGWKAGIVGFKVLTRALFPRLWLRKERLST